MIGRLSTTITAVKDWVQARTWARLGWYFVVMLSLLFFWAFSEGEAISFVYNAF